MKEKRLGRGLESLLGAVPEGVDSPGVSEIAIESIRPNPFQPRKVFSRDELDVLVRSVREKGILQPVLVRRRGDQFELIVGERRWRAAREAGLVAIPALVKALDDAQMLEVALIENTQRQDLNPIERAQAYREMMQRSHLTQDEIAARLGLDRSTIANFVRLLELAPEIQDLVSRGTLSMGHARALLAIKDPIERMRASQRIEREGLSVRQVEQFSRPATRAERAEGTTPPRFLDLEQRIREKLGSKVRIVSQGRRGYVQIEFYSLEHFEQILSKLGV